MLGKYQGKSWEMSKRKMIGKCKRKWIVKKMSVETTLRKTPEERCLRKVFGKHK